LNAATKSSSSTTFDRQLGNIQSEDHPRFHYKIDSFHNRPVTAELVDPMRT